MFQKKVIAFVVIAAVYMCICVCVYMYSCMYTHRCTGVSCVLMSNAVVPGCLCHSDTGCAGQTFTQRFLISCIIFPTVFWVGRFLFFLFFLLTTVVHLENSRSHGTDDAGVHNCFVEVNILRRLAYFPVLIRTFRLPSLKVSTWGVVLLHWVKTLSGPVLIKSGAL